jgi:oligogalacturonide transport system substrate-binding protein
VFVAAAAMLFAGTAVSQELRFAWWGGGERHEAMLAATKLFESKNPGVKIKAEYSGFQGYQERLSTQIAGKNEPDIMQVNWAWLSAFSKQGDGFYDLRKSASVVKLSEFSDNDLALTTRRVYRCRKRGMTCSLRARHCGPRWATRHIWSMAICTT